MKIKYKIKSYIQPFPNLIYGLGNIIVFGTPKGVQARIDCIYQVADLHYSSLVILRYSSGNLHSYRVTEDDIWKDENSWRFASSDECRHFLSCIRNENKV